MCTHSIYAQVLMERVGLSACSNVRKRTLDSDHPLACIYKACYILATKQYFSVHSGIRAEKE